MKKAFRVINKILLYAFFATGVILFFKGTGRVSTMLSAFGSFISSILLAWLLHTKKVDEKYWFFINIGLWLNLIGEIYAYYQGLFIYDKVLHFGIGILATMIIYEYYKDNSILKRDSVFITVLGLMFLFEIYEYAMDLFFGTQLQGVVRNSIYVQSPFNDTMYDMIWDAIGALTYLFLKKERAGEAVKRGIKNIKKIGSIKKGQVRFKLFVKNILRIK